MYFDKKTVAIGSGGFLGYYTSSGLQDDPVGTVLNTGIGVATGAFLKIPEFDLKEMSKVAIGPSVSIEDVINHKSLQRTILDNNREISLKWSDRNLNHYNSLQFHIDRKNKASINLKANTTNRLKSIEQYRFDSLEKLQERERKVLENYEKKTSRFIESKVKDRLNKLEKRAGNLEKLLPVLETKFQDLQTAQFDRNIRSGFMAYKPNKHSYLWNKPKDLYDSPKFKGHKIIGNPEVSKEIGNYIGTLPASERTNLYLKGNKAARERMASNPEYYRKIAEQRVRDKIIKYTEDSNKLLYNFDSHGLSFDSTGRAVPTDLRMNTLIDQRVIIRDNNGNIVSETTYNSPEYKALRRESKVAGKEASSKEKLKWAKNNIGQNPRNLSFNFEVNSQNGWIPQKDFIANQNKLANEYNAMQWYLDATSTNAGFLRGVEKSLEATESRMTKGFMHYEIAPNYVRSLGLDSVGTAGNLQAYLAGQSIYKSQSKHSSLSVDNIKSQIEELRNPSFLQNESEQIRKAYSAISENNKVSRDYYLDKINSERNMIKSGEISQRKHILNGFFSSRDALQDDLKRYTNFVDENNKEFLKIQNFLKSKGIQLEDRQALKDFIQTTDNSEILQTINNISKGSSVLDLRNINANKLDQITGLSIDNNPRSISQYLQRSLGHSKELADEKAAMIHKRASGSHVDFINGTVAFKDKANNQNVTLPLTSYGKAEDGTSVRFHSRGAGTYNTVTPFNPFGKHLIHPDEVYNDNGTLKHLGKDIKAVTTAYDPEMMLKFLPDNVPISSVLDNIRSLFHYDSTQSNASEIVVGENFKPTSPMFRNSQNTLNYGLTLNTNNKGVVNPDKPFKQLKTIASGEEAAESSRVIAELSANLGVRAAHLHDNVSSNALTTVQLDGYTGLAPFSPTERGSSTVGNRGYGLFQLNENTQRLKKLMGDTRFNREFSTSQALNKLDIVNASLFNELSTGILGDNSMVLSDGGGLFNLDKARDFTVTDGATIKMPLKEASITHPELRKALEAENTSEYLKKNPITIGTESLGRVGDRDIALNGMYSSGIIHSADISDGNLLLRVNAEFDPSQQRSSKLFSVGTKSLNTGVESDSFDLQTILGREINAGRITKDSQSGNYNYKGNTFTMGELRGALQSELDLQRNAGTFESVHMLSNASDTGMEDVISALQQEHLKGNTVYDRLASQGKTGADAALTALLFTEQKASTDLTATLGISLQNKIDQQYQAAFDFMSNTGRTSLNASDKVIQDLRSSGFLSDKDVLLDEAHLQAENRAFKTRFENIFGSGQLVKSRNQDAHLHAAFEMVRRSGISGSLSKGEAIAVGSFNKGQSIVGVGNRARLSWVATSQLRASGLSKEQLEMFGTSNKNMLYEVRSTLLEHQRAKHSTINDAIFGKESRFTNMLNTTPEAELRNEIFEAEFGKHPNVANNPYLTYNLSYDSHEIKSLNFSKITTPRSGKYQNDEGLNLLKGLEKKKISVMSADILYREATDSESKKIAKQRLTETLDDYLTYSRKMYSGDNSLSKAVLALESQASDIMQVKGIGGYAEKYAMDQFKANAKGQRRHVWFISEEEALHKFQQLGKNTKLNANEIDFKLIDVGDGKTLMQPVYKGEDGKWIPLSSMLTREPAQGPLSSDLIEWIVDPSLKGEHHRGQAYVANSNPIYKRAMFGDMDQDTVQTLLGNFKSYSDFESIDNIKQEARTTFADMEQLLKDIAVKGNKSKPNKTLLDFDSESTYAVYRAAGGVKGRTRKQLSAPATSLAVAYSKSLEIELGQDGDNARFLKGRMVTHQLVENLIKSAHLDTDKFTSAQRHAVDELTFARRSILGKEQTRITPDQYEKVMRDHLPTFLNMKDLKEGSTSKIQANSILEDIIGSELKHVYKVGNNPFNPMDLNEHRYRTTFSDALGNMLKESGYIDMDYASFTQRPRSSSGQVVTGMSDLIKDIYKNNKSVIFGGLGAMAGVALLGRSSPSFSDSRENLQEHSSNQMMSTKTNSADSINDTPMGINTNNLKSNFITPKVFNNKGIKVDGDFLPNAMVDGYEAYNEFSSMLDTDNIQEQAYNITNAAFGNGLRSARLQTN